MTAADATAGSVTNHATAKGKDPNGTEVTTPQRQVTIPAGPAPSGSPWTRPSPRRPPRCPAAPAPTETQYELKVGNAGSAPPTTSRRPQVRTGLTVTSASVTNTTPGGLSRWPAGTGAARSRWPRTRPSRPVPEAAPATHVWRVTVRYTVDPGQATSKSTDCHPGRGGERHRNPERGQRHLRRHHLQQGRLQPGRGRHQ
ncbi:hypothetical protein [Kitasatospora albolonga]|uniref:hypothetical protein n=1 Tax=Kitasatospora albolonga TaxID=68173 RepID=UPI0031EE8427